MKPEQLALLVASCILGYMFMSRGKTPPHDNITTMQGNTGALQTMSAAYGYVADQNKSLQQQLDEANSQLSTFKTAYEYAAK